MKARLIEQYDLTLSKREMGELMLALRVYVRDFDASPLAEELLESLDDVYEGPRLGQQVKFEEGVDETLDEEEGGTPVKA